MEAHSPPRCSSRPSCYLEKHFEFHALHGFLRVGGPDKLNYPTTQANKNPGILGQTQKYLGT